MRDATKPLYAKLTNEERAVLAFGYLAEGNETELQRVHNSVARYTYTMPDARYTAMCDSIFAMAAWWSLHHWRLRSQAPEALNTLLVCVNADHHERARKALHEREMSESRLLAMDEALDAVCGARGLDSGAVRKVAQTKAFVPSCPGMLCDQSYACSVKETLQTLLGAK